jgi:uncharacterized membrane protein
MSGALDVVTLVAALGCGLSAGVFFAFSAFVMDGLARAAPAEGMTAMQWINRRAPTPAFMLAWLGSGLACLVLAVWTPLSSGDRRAMLAIAAAAMYLAGSIAVTFARNVPMNDRLDTLDAREPGAVAYWREYVRRWTAWNHVRAATSLVAAGLLTIALTEGG